MPSWKKVIISGSNAALNSLNVSTSLTASGLNYPTTDNGEESFLQTNGSGNLSFQYVKTIYEEIYNGEATTITKGTPVYVSGSVGAAAQVFRADASNASKMPVIYISADNIASGATGRGIALGLITGVDTTGYPAGTEIYVAAGGGWTSTRPTGTNIVQLLGIVTKEGVGGQGIVLNPGPFENPNLTPGNVWVGNGNSLPVPIATSSLNVASASFATTASWATNATRVTVSTNSEPVNFKVPFAGTAASTTGNYELLQDSETVFTYNPSTNTLTVPNLAGTASWATNAITSSVAEAVKTNSAGSGTFYPLMQVGTSTGYLTPAFNSSFSFNGTTGILNTTASFAQTASFITGSNVFGPFGSNSITSASFAVSSSFATLAASATTATNATNVTITNDTTTNATYYPTFVSTTSGNTGVRVDSSTLTYNPSTNTLTVANLAGNASTATTSTLLTAEDNRIISASEVTTRRLSFGFTTWNNNNTTPYADFLHLNSWIDASGGNQNLLMFNKSSLGMRLWQQSFGVTSSYTNFKDIAWTDGTNATGTWGINITGTAATASFVSSTSNAFIQNGNSFGTTALLGTNDNQPLAFETSGSTRMFISSSGNVGIGTTTPFCLQENVGGVNAVDTALLQLRSNFSGNNTSTTLRFANSTANNAAQGTAEISAIRRNSVTSGDTDLAFKTSDGTNVLERMRLRFNGNFGIGTALPETLLHLSTFNASIIRLESTNTLLGLDSAVGEIEFRANDSSATGTGVKAKIGAYSDVAAGNAVGLRFFTGDAGFATGTEKMRITAGGFVNIGGNYTSTNNRLQVGGNVAIGTTVAAPENGLLVSGDVGIGGSPAAKLDIQASGTTQTSILGRGQDGNFRLTTRQDVSANTDGSIIGEIGVDYTTTRNTAVRFHRGGSTTGGFISFTTNNGSERARITSAGNVGIGTTAPVRELQVGGFSGSPEICIASSTTGNGALVFGDGATGNDPWRGYVQYNHSSDALIFGTTNAERARITSGGAMGLGITNPTNTAGRFEASNDIVAYSSSDKNWKKNIKNIDSPLEKLSQINGVEFDWIEDEPVHGNKGHDIGVIAQEIEQVLPEIVQTRESGMKAVQYDKIIPLLIESIKEQQKQIDELKQIINAFTK